MISTLLVGLIVLPLLIDQLLPRTHEQFFHQKTGAEFSIADAIAADDTSWIKIRGSNHSSFSSDTDRMLWYKIPLSTSVRSGRWVAEVPYAYHELVDLYFVSGNNIVPAYHRLTDISTSTVALYNFPKIHFTWDGQTPAMLFIRVQSRSMIVMAPLILAEATYNTVSYIREMGFGFLFGALITLAVYNFCIFLFARETTFLYYALYLISLFLFSFVYSGHMLRFLPNSANQYMLYLRLNLLMVTFIVFFAERFISGFLNMKFNFPTLFKIFRSFVNVSSLLALILFFFLPNRFLVVFCGVQVAVCIMSFLPVLLAQARNKMVFEFLVAWIGVSVCAFISVLSIYDVIKAGAVTSNIMFIGMYWEAVFLSIALANRIKVLMDEKNLIKSVLTGDRPQSDLNQIMEQPYGATFDKSVVERHVTIVFIDICNFSKTSAIFGSKVIFVSLADKLRTITRIIAEHGGTVDRSLGDGVLCFFGYDNSDPQVHAKQALRAAIKIQQQLFLELKAEDFKSNPILPVRIGLHTDYAHIGNLGGQNRFDVTMVGPAVNFASRLQAACAPFRIIISHETKAYLRAKDFENFTINPIHLSVKHEKSLVDAFEYDVFPEQSLALRQIERAFYAQIGNHRVDQRKSIYRESPIALLHESGRFAVCDFSKGGLGVVSSCYFAYGTKIVAKLETGQVSLDGELRTIRLQNIHFEVRWSEPAGSAYRHGLAFVGLNDEQTEYLYQLLLKASSLASTDLAA